MKKVLIINMALGVSLPVFESWLHHPLPSSLWQVNLLLLAFQMLMVIVPTL